MDAYLVGECIGRGQYSRVHSGTHKASGTPVALKLVTKPGSQPSEDQPSLVALRAEVQCQRHLRHSNILRLLACFETDQEVVFVSELCQGDLLQRLKNYGRFSEPALKEVATQLVDALHYLHQNNIIHRDLKLQNILIGLDGKYKICDFGFSKRTSAKDMTLKSVKGTPIYMAPELIKEEDYTCAVDIWALGIILFELFHGLPPFYTTNIFQLVNMILTQDISWPSNMSNDLKAFLSELLQKDPTKRIGWPLLKEHAYLSSEISVKSLRTDSAIHMDENLPLSNLSRSVSQDDLLNGPLTNNVWGQLYEQISNEAKLNRWIRSIPAMTNLVSSILQLSFKTEQQDLKSDLFLAKRISLVLLERFYQLPQITPEQMTVIKQLVNWIILDMKHVLSAGMAVHKEVLTVILAEVRQLIQLMGHFIQKHISSASLQQTITSPFVQILLPLISGLDLDVCDISLAESVPHLLLDLLNMFQILDQKLKDSYQKDLFYLKTVNLLAHVIQPEIPSIVAKVFSAFFDQFQDQIEYDGLMKELSLGLTKRYHFEQVFKSIQSLHFLSIDHPKHSLFLQLTTLKDADVLALKTIANAFWKSSPTLMSAFKSNQDRILFLKQCILMSNTVVFEEEHSTSLEQLTLSGWNMSGSEIQEKVHFLPFFASLAKQGHWSILLEMDVIPLIQDMFPFLDVETLPAALELLTNAVKSRKASLDVFYRLLRSIELLSQVDILPALSGQLHSFEYLLMMENPSDYFDFLFAARSLLKQLECLDQYSHRLSKETEAIKSMTITLYLLSRCYFYRKGEYLWSLEKEGKLGFKILSRIIEASTSITFNDSAIPYIFGLIMDFAKPLNVRPTLFSILRDLPQAKVFWGKATRNDHVKQMARKIYYVVFQ